MTATAAQIAQIRRMTAEPTVSPYTDEAIQGYIESYPILDEQGEPPYTLSSATPPAQVANTNWIATYDLHAAAADIWEEKAAAWADKYDFSADGGNYSRSKAYEQMMSRVRYHRARRAAKTMTAVKWPDENDGKALNWIINMPETD